MKNTLYVLRRTALLSALVVCGHAWADAPLATTAVAAAATAAVAAELDPETVFARVGDSVITFEEYNNAFGAAARGKFYHGKAPENEVAKLQRDVADKLVGRVLLLREAKRRGIAPDTAEIQKTIDAYEKRYGNSEQWKKTREQVLPGLTARLTDDSLVKQLEKTVRAIPAPQPAEVEAYYEANKDKFTEPERMRVSSILLKVDPSSPPEARQQADAKAKELYKSLKDGADFATLARENSDDKSGVTGGDMGYLHKGMIPPAVQDMLATMKPGETSEPVHLLEGVAIIRLTERVESRQLPLERVLERATLLLKRDKSEAVWNELVAELRKATPAQIKDGDFLPLVETTEEDASNAPK